jgi:hypothetical protein
MKARTPPGALRTAAWFAVAALLISLAVGVLHKDDGCAVERHCPACVFAFHLADHTIELTLYLPASRPTGEVVSRALTRISSGEQHLVASRGPPAA